MTWTVILVASAGCYLVKAAGALAGRRIPDSDRTRALTATVTVALLTALIVTQTVADGRALRFDARIAGLAAAALVIWRRGSFLLVVVVAAAVTAAARALGMP
jgi:hypothetical protein